MDPQNNKSKRNIVTILVIVLVAVIGFGAYYYYTNFCTNQGKDKVSVGFSNSSASTGDAILSFTPSVTSVQINGTFTVNVNINTQGKQISAAEVHITLPANIQGMSIAVGSFLPVTLEAPTISGQSVSVTLGSQPMAPVTGTGTIAVLTLKGLSAGSATIQFDSTTKVAAIGETRNFIDAMNPTTITIAAVQTTPAPTINTFTASPDKITRGYEDATLSWNIASTTTANTMSINQGVGNVSTLIGTKKVAPTASTITYTLTAQNTGGTSSKQVQILTYRPGDLDKLNGVNIMDYTTLIANFGHSGTPAQGNVNRDSIINIFDYNLLVTNFGGL